VLQGAKGLLGLNGGYGSGTNYFDQMAAEHTPLSFNGKEVQNPYPEVLNRQYTYLNHQIRIIQYITDAIDYKDTVYGSSTCSTGNLSPSLNTRLTRALSEKSAVELLIPEVEMYSSDYGLLLSASTPQVIITPLLTKYGAKTIIEARSKLMTEYSFYTTSGSLHTDVENITLELQTIPDIQAEINSFTSTIDRACDSNNR